jgi:hypothetical protein
MVLDHTVARLAVVQTLNCPPSFGRAGRHSLIRADADTYFEIRYVSPGNAATMPCAAIEMREYFGRLLAGARPTHA